MGKITDIAPQKKNKKRMSIYIDGSFVCGLEGITVLSRRLQIGDEIDAEELGAIQLESERQTAFEKALKYMTARMHTKKEMRKYLKDKGYLDCVIDEVTDKLIDYGYVDDAKFASMYVDAYRKKHGASRIKYDLRRLGVASETVEEALEDLDADEQAEEAERLAYKFMRLRDGSGTDREKVCRNLFSKGFSWDLIPGAYRRAKTRLEDEEAAEAEESEEN